MKLEQKLHTCTERNIANQFSVLELVPLYEIALTRNNYRLSVLFVPGKRYKVTIPKKFVDRVVVCLFGSGVAGIAQLVRAWVLCAQGPGFEPPYS